MNEKKVLIVDDSSTFRAILKDELKEADYQLLIAKNGEEAIELFKENSPDLITLDIEMPKMSGLDVCREIRKIESESKSDQAQLKRTPIIFLTTKNSTEDRDEGLKAGGSIFVNKEVLRGELKFTIDKILKIDTNRLENQTMVLIDDSKVTHEFITSHLSKFKLNIMSFTDSTKALDYIKQYFEEIDIIVTDENMPNLNGSELCQIIREELNIRTLPIIFISSEREKDKIVNFFNIGATDYLSKPFCAEEFTARINSHLEISKLYKDMRVNALKIKKLSDVKDKFLAMCSHDLKTPINGIIGLTQVLLDQDNSFSSDEKEMIELISRSAEDLNHLINDLLDLDKINSNTHQNKEKHKSVNFSNLLKNTISEFKYQCQEKDLIIDFKDIQDNLIILGEEYDLKRVILNLLSNAIKFSKQGSTINVKASLNHSGKITCLFKDHGIGMPLDPEVDPFNNFGTSGQKGTNGEKSHGYGLYIIKRIIDNHQANISVSSEINKGTEFTLEFKKAA